MNQLKERTKINLCVYICIEMLAVAAINFFFLLGPGTSILIKVRNGIAIEILGFFPPRTIPAIQISFDIQGSLHFSFKSSNVKCN